MTELVLVVRSPSSKAILVTEAASRCVGSLDMAVWAISQRRDDTTLPATSFLGRICGVNESFNGTETLHTRQQSSSIIGHRDWTTGARSAPKTTSDVTASPRRKQTAGAGSLSHPLATPSLPRASGTTYNGACDPVHERPPPPRIESWRAIGQHLGGAARAACAVD